MGAEQASNFQMLGAGAFGFLMGWQLFFVNRYRRDGVSLADLGGIVAALGGTAVLALFPASTDLFGAYGLGLFLGFFSYFLILVILVARSPNFSAEWFLDGRRKAPTSGETTEGTEQTSHPMQADQHLRG